MPSRPDNPFHVPRGPLLDALAAVLAGNALYFLVLLPWLPQAWRHQPFALDPGAALDFLLCLALYLLLRFRRRWFDEQRARK